MQENYQSISDMEGNTVSGKRFYVHVEGNSSGAHDTIVSWLKRNSHVQVFSDEECDYILAFCVVASRIGTDIKDTLENCPGNKPKILVVMHHTFRKDCVLADSRLQVEDPGVILTVDILFHQGKLLRCDRNNISKYEMFRTLHIPQVQALWCLPDWLTMTFMWIFGLALLVLVVIIIIISIEVKSDHAHAPPNPHNLSGYPVNSTTPGPVT